MPRHPRVHAEGLLYHVIARGNDGQKIFLRQSDYQVLHRSASDRSSVLPVLSLRLENLIQEKLIAKTTNRVRTCDSSA